MLQLVCVKDFYSDSGARLFTKDKIYDFVEFLGAYMVTDDEFNTHDVNGRAYGLGRWTQEMLDHFEDIKEDVET